MKQMEQQRFENLATIATFILGTGGSLCVLSLFYFIYVYTWPGQKVFFSAIEIVLYSVLAAVLAGGFFGSLMLGPLGRIKLALVLISSTASIYAANLLLVIYDTKIVAATRTLQGSIENDIPEIVKLAKNHGVEYDARGKLDVIDNFNKKGVSAVPVVHPVNLLREQPQDNTRRSVISLNGIEVLPLGGISNTTTVYCNETGQYVIYQSDEHGFHNPKRLWNSNPLDLMALGDSFTQGACVPSSKNFVALIRKRFPKTLNLGMGGNGPLLELATLIEYVEVLRPKIVLWFFFEGNDIWDLHRERKSPLLMRYLAGNFKQFLLHRQPEIDQALLAFLNAERGRFNFTFPEKQKELGKAIRQASRLLQDGVKLVRLRQRLDSVLGYIGGDSYQSDARSEAAMRLLPTVLKQAKASVAALGSKLYFVILPQRERYSDGGFANDTRHQVLSIVKELGIPLIDVHAAFQNHADPLDLFPFRRMYHYNEKGHKMVADFVFHNISR